MEKKSNHVDMKDFYQKHNDQIQRKVQNYTNQIKQGVKEVGEWTAINYVYIALDNMLDKAKKDAKKDGKRVTCTKGCSFCCYSEVTCSDLEWKGILEFLRRWNIEMPPHNPKHSVSRNEFNKLPWEEKKCPFLVNNTCGIYSIRPATCRIFNSTDDPVKCKKTSHIPEQNPTNEELIIVDGQLLITALHKYDNELKYLEEKILSKRVYEYQKDSSDK